ncbi:hypothetical protein BCT86_13860 [Vibrio breoganii]|uniref:Uncharacterized protein n=1 Tax=Vibrio breoganii TaxID=553239 RepID=A0AAN0XXH1_9VIBR|nr:hypothetical protein A6E01_13885 [Vibrio breoganii]OED84832.1 hypothetical protein A1QE_02475 [Vibrio breoganii ZF-55]OCH73088.1 hypothetical protein A6D95_16860 [Vibrio breoganii]PMG39353.1 hypothetical protein BCU93_11870 [Vibrio breoganii]PMG85857.1 hypothetical protein BCU83_18065 [Vibrio breoganii]
MSWPIFFDFLSVLLLVVLAVAATKSMDSLRKTIWSAQKNHVSEEIVRKSLAKLSLNRAVLVLTIATIVIKVALILGQVLDFDSIDKSGLLDDAVVQYIVVE